MDDTAMMREAIREALLARDEGETPVGAVVALDGEIVARARNARERLNDPTAHAEILALRAAAKAIGDWRLRGATLYVTLEPCPMCAGALVAARVERLVFGAYDENAGCAGSVYRVPEDPAFNHFVVCDGGVLEAECRAILDAFFASARGLTSAPEPRCRSDRAPS